MFPSRVEQRRRPLRTVPPTCASVRRLSELTISAYENDLYQFSAALPACECITATMIRDGLTKIAENRRFVPATIKRKIAAVRTIFCVVDAKRGLETFGDWHLKIKMPARLPKAVPVKELRILLKSDKPTMPDAARGGDSTHLCLPIYEVDGQRGGCHVNAGAMPPHQECQNSFCGITGTVCG